MDGTIILNDLRSLGISCHISSMKIFEFPHCVVDYPTGDEKAMVIDYCQRFGLSIEPIVDDQGPYSFVISSLPINELHAKVEASILKALPKHLN